MYLPEFLNLGTGFSKYFQILPALDDELRAAVYRIRHSVYCEELGYEPPRPEGMETDAFDARSAHCLLRSASNGEYVGCIRIVLADPEDPKAPLPFEKLCGATIDRSIIDLASIDRRKVAEVSRLAVIRRYRRRKGEMKTPVGLSEGDFGTPTQPRFPYIAVGLYLGMMAQARHHGVETLLMLTERRLARQLGRLGVNLRAIGPPVAHRGTRYPSMLSVNETLDGFSFFVRPLFAVIAGEIAAGYRNAKLAG